MKKKLEQKIRKELTNLEKDYKLLSQVKFHSDFMKYLSGLKLRIKLEQNIDLYYEVLEGECEEEKLSSYARNFSDCECEYCLELNNIKYDFEKVQTLKKQVEELKKTIN